MSDTDKTKAIVEALKTRHTSTIWVEELRFSSGARRCDFWTLHPHRAKGYHAVAYEIKVSRQDWKRDNAIKQRDARLYSDEFYYITPPGLLEKEEIPEWAGLMEWSPDKGFKTPISAPHRDKDAPSWELVVSILRSSGEHSRDTEILKKDLFNMKQQYKALEARYQAHVLC